jgi:ribosomal protein S21
MPKIGHIKVKVARNAYHVLEHIGNNSYKKIATLYKFADTLPYRNAKWMTHNGQLKYRDFPDPKEKVTQPIKSRTIAPPKPKRTKVVQTMECTLAAKDKALQRIETKEGIVIAEQNRPQKVRVIVDSKTSIMVYPNEAENAIARFNKRYQQSQEQSHIHQRKPVAKPKQKEHKSDLIFFH